jgi:hypothetical protein
MPLQITGEDGICGQLFSPRGPGRQAHLKSRQMKRVRHFYSVSREEAVP